MDNFEQEVTKRLEEMNDEIVMHKTMHMENEGVFIEEIDEKPVTKSFNETMKDLLKDFSK